MSLRGAAGDAAISLAMTRKEVNCHQSYERVLKADDVVPCMLLLGIDLKQSYVIGDSDVDVEMGRRAGCKAGIKVAQATDGVGYWHANSFKDAVQWIIKQERYLTEKVD